MKQFLQPEMDKERSRRRRLMLIKAAASVASCHHHWRPQPELLVTQDGTHTSRIVLEPLMLHRYRLLLSVRMAYVFLKVSST
ncbi:hypothetical protein ZWY2020_032943 [Hordeum vulgare]|nr:hypothetical protein ZWY2020_032943 [Hordeum vulgare]